MASIPEKKRRARFFVTPELLREFLRLPCTTTVIAARTPPFNDPYEGYIEFLVEDENLKETEVGNDFPVIHPIYTKQPEIVCNLNQKAD